MRTKGRHAFAIVLGIVCATAVRAQAQESEVEKPMTPAPDLRTAVGEGALLARESG